VIELKTIDGATHADACRTETPFDGAGSAGIEFQIGQRFEGSGKTEILRRSFSQDLIQIPAHGCQSQASQFLV